MFPKAPRPAFTQSKYSPISLLLVNDKVDEAVLLRCLQTNFELRPYFSKVSFGFRLEHSRTQQILRFTGWRANAFNLEKTKNLITEFTTEARSQLARHNSTMLLNLINITLREALLIHLWAVRINPKTTNSKSFIRTSSTSLVLCTLCTRLATVPGPTTHGQ
ncbi:hypothetical protein Zmor_008918 [Zophobas morio]|uniref:Uncharacterized protein n=1 Tax=Zophobas morio TaxID=2755281 RepID=A0AA38M006_9CUCU|nr:hypothetical protein Zmor_008918 [Zophobas morio]